MTRITRAGIILDPQLYKDVGSPGRLHIYRDGWDVLLIPGSEGYLVTLRRGRPYILMPQKYQQNGLIKTGTFNSKPRQLFNVMTYEITDACTYYAHFRDEQ